MTDALATKQDLRELEARLDARFARVDSRIDGLERHFDTRLSELEKRMEVRFNEQAARLAEQDARFQGQLAGLEHRMTLRLGGMLIASIGAFSALLRFL